MLPIAAGRDNAAFTDAAIVAKGHDIAVTHEVRRITGVEPKSFAARAEEHHARFR